MVDEKRSPQPQKSGGSGEKSTSITDTRPGNQYGSEGYRPPVMEVDPKVANSSAYKNAKEKFGPAAHEIKWGADTFWGYTEINNPFYYRLPKGIQEIPAHVPQNPINLELHLRHERQRLTGMTNAEREWRKKYVKDQELHADEPFFVSEAQFHMNPIRRLYRWPLDTLGRKFLYPKLGVHRGQKIRQIVPKCFMLFMGVEIFYYTLKYNHETWIDRFRCSITPQQPILVNRIELETLHPELLEKAFPSMKNPEDFFDLGFSKRQIFLNLDETKRPW